MDFRNNMQKVYVSEEEKEKFMEKLNRDVEVSELLLQRSATGWRHHTSHHIEEWFKATPQAGTNAGEHVSISALSCLMF